MTLESGLSKRADNEFNADSYADLVNNGDFLDTASSVLANVFGEDVPFEAEEIVDLFYEKFREVDSNTLDAMRFYNRIGDMSSEDEQAKLNLHSVYQTYRSLPTFWEDDTVDKGKAFVDYAASIFTDPFTYASAIGGSGFAAKAVAKSLVSAGVNNATKAGLKSAALGSAAIDTATAVLGDAYIQGAEMNLKDKEGQAIREEWSYLNSAIAGGLGALGGPAVGATGRLVSNLATSSSKIQNAVAEGKKVYLNNSEVGQAFLNGQMVEGSFVSIKGGSPVKGAKAKKENLGYIESIIDGGGGAGEADPMAKAVINIGFDEKTGEAIQKTVEVSRLNLEDPFSNTVQAKIRDQVLMDSKAFNREQADKGFNDLQEAMFEQLGITKDDISDYSFILNESAVERINSVYLKLIQESSMIYNPNKRISQNIADALRNDLISTEKLNEILSQRFVSKQEFGAFLSGSYLGSASQAGKILGRQGNTAQSVMKEFKQMLNGGIGTQFKKVTAGVKSEGQLQELVNSATTSLKNKKNLQPVEGSFGIKEYAEKVLKNPDLSPEAEEYFSKALAQRSEAGKWTQEGNPQFLNTILRLGMISQPATTIRNVMGAVIRSPVDATTRTFDNAITSVFNMFGGGKQIRPVSWKDGMDHVTSLFNPQEQVMLTDFIMTQKPELRAQIFSGPEAYKEAAEVLSQVKGTQTGLINGTTNFIEKGFVKLNIANSLQDRYHKATAFNLGLKHALARDNLDLYDLLSKGKIQNIDQRYFDEASEWALEFNYQAKGLEDWMPGGRVLLEMSKLPYGVGAVVAPFPKFFLNSMKFMYEHSLLAAPKYIWDLGATATLRKEALTGFEKQQAIKRASRMLSGQALLATAFAIRNSSLGGENWFDFRDYDGGMLNIATYYPLAPALYVAEGINQLINWISMDEGSSIREGRQSLRKVFGGKRIDEFSSANELAEAWALDFTKALGGASSRAGIWRTLDRNSLGAIISGDEEFQGTALNALGKYMGSLAAALVTPVKTVTDVYREMNLEDDLTSARMIRNAQSSDGFFPNFVAQILKDTPLASSYLDMEDIGIRLNKKGEYVYMEEVPYGSNKDGSTRVAKLKYNVLNPAPMRYSSPALKQLTGMFKSRQKNEVETEFDRLGIPSWKIFRPTKVKDWDHALEVVSSSIMSDYFYGIINSKEYKTFGLDDKPDLSAQRALIKTSTAYIKQKITDFMKEGTRVGVVSNAMKISPSLKPTVVEIMKRKGYISEDQKYTDKISNSLTNNQLIVMKDIDRLFRKVRKNIAKKRGFE